MVKRKTRRRAKPSSKKPSLATRKNPPPLLPSPPPAPIPPPIPSEIRETETVTSPSPPLPCPPLSLPCTAEVCNKRFQAATEKLVRKALMRHLHRYQKHGSTVPADVPDSDLTRKQIIDRAHRLAYAAEVRAYSNLPLPPLTFHSTANGPTQKPRGRNKRRRGQSTRRPIGRRWLGRLGSRIIGRRLRRFRGLRRRGWWLFGSGRRRRRRGGR